MSAPSVLHRTYKQLQVSIFPDADLLGAQAAEDLSAILQEGIAQRGEARIIVATGNSQLPLMNALRQRRDIAWGQVEIFHMDEYLGMAETHPASFRRYLQEKLVDHIHPRAFHGMRGDAPNPAAEMRRYTDLLQARPLDAVVMGIGENGHLAFNDPPADFATREWVHIVNLDEACRRQQLGEGWFPSLADVPMQALSLTVHALLAPRRLLVVVPERRKAAAVRAALEGPVTPNCPASILQEQAHAALYLDAEAASLLA